MPFQSEKQRRFLHANHPEIARRWERDYANGGRIGFKRAGLASAPWLRGKSGSGNIKAWRGKEGWKEAQKLAEKFNLKNKAATTGIFAALLAATEAGTIGVDKAAEMLGKEKTGLYKPSDFYKMYKKYMAQKELLKRYEVFKTRGGPEMHEDYKSGYYKEQMPKIDSGEDKVYGKPKDYVYPPEEPKEEIDWNIINKFKNDPTLEKIKKWFKERKGQAKGGIAGQLHMNEGDRIE